MTHQGALKERQLHPQRDMADWDVQLQTEDQEQVGVPPPLTLLPDSEADTEILSLYRREDLEDADTNEEDIDIDSGGMDLDIDNNNNNRSDDIASGDEELSEEERAAESCSPVMNESGDEEGAVEALMGMHICDAEQRNINSRLAQALAEVNRLRQELAESRTKVESLESYRAECESLRADLEGAKRERTELVDALQKSKGERKKLKERLILSEELRARNRMKRSAREPGERMMRKLFAEKVEQLALTHARTTARMLNVQKRCFEEELETLEGEAHATVVAFERQMIALKEEAAAKDEEYNREKDTTYAKTAAVMAAVRQKIENMQAEGARTIRRLEAEKNQATAAAKERHNALIDIYRERNEAKLQAQKSLDDIERKNVIVQSLQQQLQSAMTQLAKSRRLISNNNNNGNRGNKNNNNQLPVIC